MPKLTPFECLHKTLHPARFDGSRTVCLDCEQVVGVVVGPAGVAYQNALDRLNQIRTEELRAELVAHEAQNTKGGV